MDPNSNTQQELGDFGAASSLPVADIKAPDAAPLYSSRSFPVRQPIEDAEDFMIEVRASVLRAIRHRVEKATKALLPWGEILLAIGSTTGGAFLGALPADVTGHPKAALLLLRIFPVIAGCALVAYFFVRRDSSVSTAELSEDVLERLPDPDKTSPRGIQHE